MVSEPNSFRNSNAETLREAQNALNVAFGAILSAYVGNSLAEIDNHPFDHVALGWFFLAVAIFILGLCVGNSVILRGDYGFGTLFLAIAAAAALAAHYEGRRLGCELVILRVLPACWVFGLLGSNAFVTAINFVHHRNRK